jgi:hypothetical protein
MGALRKEILGWVFDGARCCIKLPADKVTKITTEIHRVTRKDTIPHKQFEQLRGNSDTHVLVSRRAKD